MFLAMSSLSAADSWLPIMYAQHDHDYTLGQEALHVPSGSEKGGLLEKGCFGKGVFSERSIF